MKFEIFTPTGIKYSGFISSVTVTTLKGRLAILKDHKPMILHTLGGVLDIIEDSGERKRIFASDGLLKIKDNDCYLLSDFVYEDSFSLTQDIEKDSLLFKDNDKFKEISKLIKKEVQ